MTSQKNRGTAISRLEVSGIKGYAARQQRQCDMAGAQRMGWKQGRHPSMSAVRHPLDLRSLGSSKNYEDSIRRRHQMEQEATMRDSIGRLMIRQSQDIKKKLK